MLKKLTAAVLSFILAVSVPAVSLADDKYTDLTSEVVVTPTRMQRVMNSSVVFAEGLSKLVLKGESIEMTQDGKPLKVFSQNDRTYVPAVYAAKAFGAGYEYYPEEERIYIKFKNYSLHFKTQSDTYSVNGKTYDFPGAGLVKDNVYYVALEVFEAFMDDTFYRCANGLIIIAPFSFRLDTDDFTLMSSLEAAAAAELCYERPDASQIKALFEEKTPDGQHPRMIIDAGRKKSLLEWTANNEDFIKIKESIIKSADMAIEKPVAVYALDSGGRLIATSRDAKAKLQPLAMAYLLTGEQKYVDRAWLEFETVEAYDSWHPEHFLDVAEMAIGVAMMYDWMYDGLTEQQRKIMQECIVEKVLLPAQGAYTGSIPSYDSYSWTKAGSNWNVVCNGGIAAAALAIAGDTDDPGTENLIFECLEAGLKSIEAMMPTFAPQGAWMEGMSYWGFTMEFFGYYMAAMLSAVGDDFGILSSPGVSRTAYYPMNLARPNGSVFRFGDDGSSGGGRTNEYPLLAYVFNDGFLQKKVNAIIKNGSGGLSELMYYHPEVGESDAYFELDNKYLGIAEVLTMRSDFEDSNALFVGARGGMMAVNHGHSDIGSFVFDADGIEWFKDGLSGSYEWPNQAQDRYKYYRNASESHNMLVVNPSDDDQLVWDSVTPINLVSKERGAYATLDMSDTYKPDKDVASAKRGLALINDRTSFLVQDEVKTNNPAEIYWFGHTRADITLSDDGKSAVLERNGKQLYVEILSPAEGVFTVEKDEPLDVSFQYAGQEDYYYADVNKLRIHLTGVTDTTVSVFMTPVREGIDVKEKVPEVTPIDEWSIPDGEIPKLDSITVGGNELASFSQYSDSCTVYFEEESSTAPVVEAKSSVYDVSVQQAEAVPGKAIVTMSSGGVEIKKYYVCLELENQLGVIEGKKKYKVVSVEASAVPESHNPPSGLIDNNIETKWAAENDQWVLFDLGEERTADTLGVGWYDPTNRISPFEIEVSTDGVSWTTVYSGKSRGVNTEIETYSFAEVQARYVRLNVHGHGTPPSGWNSIMEVCIYGPQN